MGLKMAATSFPSSQALASTAVSSPKRRRFDGSLFFPASRSRVRTLAAALSADGSDSFPDEEFFRRTHDFAARFGRKAGDFDPFQAMVPASIERKANSIGIAMSLRIIKRKNQSAPDGSSAWCSVKKAFSSMVFIIRELHSHTLQMREALFSEDLQGIVATVQTEIHAAFVWLFQKVFSQSPTLMVHVMILLANYTVYSMSCNAAVMPPPPPVVETEEVSDDHKFDASNYLLKLGNFGNTASVGGNDGGGGKCRPVASGMNGDGKFDESNHRGSNGISCNEEEENERYGNDDDDENNDGLVSKIEVEDNFRRELQYKTELAEEPNNSLLLANFAQFLYVAAKDYDRAERYFKKATEAEPKDAEAWSKYANFLWVVRNDLWGAEEAYLEAISVEPSNSYYAANYAHFLWNTGGEDTCFPLDDPS